MRSGRVATTEKETMSRATSPFTQLCLCLRSCLASTQNGEAFHSSSGDSFPVYFSSVLQSDYITRYRDGGNAQEQVCVSNNHGNEAKSTRNILAKNIHIKKSRIQKRMHLDGGRNV